MPAYPQGLGWQLDSDNTIRIRLYESFDPLLNKPLTGGFNFQLVLTQAQWNTLLVAIGTGSGGSQAGTASTEVYTIPVNNAGLLPPNWENS